MRCRDVEARADTVFLLDVDNTLLDNDTVIEDLRSHLAETFGQVAETKYFEIFEELRAELGYADYLGALQRFRLANPHDVHLVEMSLWLVEYPFEQRLYSDALEVVRHLEGFGLPVVLTDGDVVFQPRKIDRSGIRHAVRGRVLVYVHKERELEDVERRFPAERYVLIDDKLRILNAVKTVWGERVTTVFPRQGHYAHDPEILESCPPADVSIDRIGDLLSLDPSHFR
jgi:FMN phosphatase YigB (HAD superfamily)